MPMSSKSENFGRSVTPDCRNVVTVYRQRTEQPLFQPCVPTAHVPIKTRLGVWYGIKLSVS